MRPEKPELKVHRRSIEIHRQSDIGKAVAIVERNLHRYMQGGKPVVIQFTRPKRTPEQNNKMWGMLRDISRQVLWDGKRMEAADWKILFSAHLAGYDMARGIGGGFVMLGTSTSQMTKQQISDMIEIMYSFGAERDVIWSEEAKV